MDNRVKLPATVLIHGTPFPVVDWSFSGFAVANDEGLKVSRDDVLDIVFQLPFAHYTAQSTLRAEVRNINPKTIGFEFYEVDHAVRLLMREYVESVIEHRVSGKPETLTSPQPQSAPTALGTTPPTPPSSAHVGKALQYAAFVTVLLLTLLWILSSQRYMMSTQAGLVGNTLEIRARSEGYLQKIHVSVGDEVQAGQLLIQLDEQEAKRNLHAASYLQQQLERSVGASEKLLQEETRRSALYSRVASSRKQVEQARADETRSQLAQAESELKRVDMLREGGYVSASWADSHRFAAQQKKAQLAQVMAEASLASGLADEARQGRFFSTNQVWNRNEDLRMAVEQQRAALAQSTVQLGPLLATLEHMKITSPENGRVRILSRNPGELVREGELLAVLETPRLASVLAKFDLRDAERLAPGQTARVHFPAIDQTVEGIVEAVGSQGLVTQNGLANVAESSINETPAIIRLTGQVPHLPSGLRARVEVDTGQSLFTVLHQRMR